MVLPVIEAAAFNAELEAAELETAALEAAGETEDDADMSGSLDARVQPRVEQIDHDVGDDHDERTQHQNAQHDGNITRWMTTARRGE